MPHPTTATAPKKRRGRSPTKSRARSREVRTALDKNMRLLSFSMDHVKSSLEKVVEFINRTSYQKGRTISVMVSRQV